ncbi:hypothetical protein SEA_JUMBO_94 [Gordonia phage Jumbo]|uniref:Uncharacterized protein n=1 Tax=Gordonia phage Jumbo TaxID=1887650 RepID=A0A1B3B0S6_9CAUD|nr:hypothetical protein BIZ69_gp094 [Gordonia phage Jumbo]AOE44615.1 hypothetical protein SEA_JUMBO_94 [Gordonia phage Jumbo]
MHEKIKPRILSLVITRETLTTTGEKMSEKNTVKVNINMTVEVDFDFWQQSMKELIAQGANIDPAKITKRALQNNLKALMEEQLEFVCDGDSGENGYAPIVNWLK